MNKLISKIVGVALGLTLAVGTGVAIGVSSKNAARAEAAGNDVTFNFASIASTNSWTNGTAYTSINIDPITITANGGGNNGKYYTSDTSWRMYNGGSISITTSNGSITAVTSTPSQTFSISNGAASLSLSATVKFTSITVTYTAGSVTPTLETPEPVFDSTDLEVSWEDVDNATSYQYKIDNGEYTTGTSPVDVSNETAGSHTFSVIAKASGYNDSEAGTCNFTIPSADGYVDATMAAGTNASAASVNSKDAIKAGTKSDGGSVTITVPSGSTAIRFYAAAWKGATITLSATPTEKMVTTSFALTADDGISNNSPFTLSGNESDFLFENVFLNNITAETTITLTGSGRYVVWGAQYTTQSTSVISVTGVSVTPETATIAYGGSTTLTATVSPSDATVKTVSWTSSNEEVATVAADGTVTAVDAGTATITATTTDGNFTDSCTITVSAPTFTEKDVAGAIQVINGLTDGSTTTDYYKVTGYVVEITYQYSSTSGDMSFTIADAKGGTPVLTCYRVKCSAAVASTILKDAKISLVGKLQKFVKNSVTTPELVQNVPSQITIIEPGVQPQTYVVTFAEALNIISGLANNKPTYDKYTVQGVVNQITNTYSSGKISFTIGATENASETIKIFDLVLNATDAAKVEVGATIQVTGNLELYNGSTNELINGESFELISAPQHETKEIYDLDFVFAQESDSSTELTTTTWRNVIQGDAEEMSCSAISKVYGGANNTLKFSSSNTKGSITLEATDASISRVIICAKAYMGTSSGQPALDESAIVVNSGTAQTLEEDWKYYTFDLSTSSSQITIEGSKAQKCRFYIKDLILIDESTQDAIDAYGYAATFMNATSEECAATNVSSSTWTTVSGAWTSLSSDGKGYFADKNANATGNLVEEMLARYEIIVKGYSYENFMNRNLNGSRSFNVINNNNALVIVVITAFVTMTFVGGYFFLRKKKEN